MTTRDILGFLKKFEPKYFSAKEIGLLSGIDNISTKVDKAKPKPRNNPFGDPEINAITKHLEETIGCTLDGTKGRNRQYSSHLLKRFKKDYPQNDAVTLIKDLITRGYEVEFHKTNMNH